MKLPIASPKPGPPANLDPPRPPFSQQEREALNAWMHAVTQLLSEHPKVRAPAKIRLNVAMAGCDVLMESGSAQPGPQAENATAAKKALSAYAGASRT